MRVKSVNSELEIAKTRLANAQAEKYELKNAVLRGEYVKRSDINRAYAEIITNVKNKLLALPAMLAPKLIGDNERVIASKIEMHIRQILEEFGNENGLIK